MGFTPHSHETEAWSFLRRSPATEFPDEVIMGEEIDLETRAEPLRCRSEGRRNDTCVQDNLETKEIKRWMHESSELDQRKNDMASE